MTVAESEVEFDCSMERDICPNTSKTVTEITYAVYQFEVISPISYCGRDTNDVLPTGYIGTTHCSPKETEIETFDFGYLPLSKLKLKKFIRTEIITHDISYKEAE